MQTEESVVLFTANQHGQGILKVKNYAKYLLLVTVFLSSHVLAADAESLKPGNKVNAEGVIEDFNFYFVDDLLLLDQLKVKLIIFRVNSEVDVSSAHLALFKKWVQSGGVGYITGLALRGSLSNKLDLVEFAAVKVEKESGVEFDRSKGVGELFVKDLLPLVEISNHPLTKDVNMLYVGAAKMRARNTRNDYDVFALKAKNNQPTEPILRLGTACVSEPSASFVVENIRINGSFANCEGREELVNLILAIPDGEGTTVFDGTGLMSMQNDFKDNVYDFDVYYQNLLNYSSKSP